jgi:hypothetical protein
MATKYIRIPDEEKEESTSLLAILCKIDKRTEGKETAWIIREEYARRFSQPSPVLVGEALEASRGPDSSHTPIVANSEVA